MTVDLNALMDCPPEILDQLHEALREVKAIEPAILAVLDKASVALRAFDDRHSAVVNGLAQEHLSRDAQDSLSDAIFDLTPAVGQLWSALYEIEELIVKARESGL